MLTTIKEAFGIFCINDPVISKNGSFSKFADLRPVHVLLHRNIPHNVCLCKIHENVKLLLNCLDSQKIGITSDFNSLINQVVCDANRESCMFGNCSVCPGFDPIIAKILPEKHDELCRWAQWNSNSKDISKVDIEGSTLDCLNDLKSLLPQFLEHTYVKRAQSATFKQTKENINDNELCIQLDFAENYSCCEQNEIQSAYWGYKQITVFTAVAWYKEHDDSKIQSYALITDYLSHDKYAVHTFIKSILSDLKTKIKITKINFFSDGAASQFKQKFNLCNMSLLKDDNVEIAGHFFATSHGKGAVDGIGGEVKRCARLLALSGKPIHNALDFVKVVKEKENKICLMHIPSCTITKCIPELDKMWDDIVAIPALHKTHFIKAVAPYKVVCGMHSLGAALIPHEFLRKSKKTKVAVSKSGDVTGDRFEVSIESYYAVFYDSQFYIGRALSIEPLQKIKFKFLHETFPQAFNWPINDDIDIIESKFVFYGPVTLVGTCPFSLPDYNKIKCLYKALKK